MILKTTLLNDTVSKKTGIEKLVSHRLRALELVRNFNNR